MTSGKFISKSLNQVSGIETSDCFQRLDDVDDWFSAASALCDSAREIDFPREIAVVCYHYYLERFGFEMAGLV
jgi:hypothetical protein